MNYKKTAIVLTVTVAAAFGSISLAAPTPTTAPATSQPASGGVIAVSDKAALDAAGKDQDVTVEGVVKDATWSGTGKVMNISFVGTDDSKFEAVIFVKNRDKIDQAFGGDAAKAWTGAKIRIKGKIRQYGGKSDPAKAHPELTISDPAQVTVVSPATSQPAK